MSIRPILVGLLFPLVFYPQRADAKSPSLSAYSPSGNYSCVVVSLEQGEKILFQSRIPPKSEILLETPRWATPQWSRRENWFCVEDHIDGHNTNVHIYNIKKTLNGEVAVAIKWSNPEPTLADSHWTLAAWDIEHGQAKLKHYFQEYDGLNPTHHWKTRWLTISLR